MCPLRRILLIGSLFKQTGSNSCRTPATSVSRAFEEVLSPKSDTFAWKPHDLAAVISLPHPNYRKLASEVKKLADVATLPTCRGVRMHVSEQHDSGIASLHQQKSHGWSCKHSSALPSNSATPFKTMLSAPLLRLPAYTLLVCTCSTVTSDNCPHSAALEASLMRRLFQNFYMTHRDFSQNR